MRLKGYKHTARYSKELARKCHIVTDENAIGTHGNKTTILRLRILLVATADGSDSRILLSVRPRSEMEQRSSRIRGGRSRRTNERAQQQKKDGPATSREYFILLPRLIQTIFKRNSGGVSRTYYLHRHADFLKDLMMA